ncbi:hypothetical protein FJW06_21305 [Mesorhizobium sp. B4-1-3]|uniref:hypothetical protein n=1 Tax=Mesorhizobium sp. B4-1-3 TaxID=2589889 RepID=UPI00112BF624|nr:hypothetical protein [Mesorhizobium sp. B4-1-3]TPI10945.1 hypothetical protein FJW06_21305 [Mesorhizobium sp. B4-1-3]
MSRLEQGFAAVGIAGLVLCALGAPLDAKAMLGAWLAAALFALSLSLGALTILMVHGLTGGRWGEAVRQPLRIMIAMLPFALVLLLPVLMRLDLVFPWAGADSGMLPEKVREKLAYLNVPFFLLRCAVCAAIWLVLTWMVLDATSDEASSNGRNGKKLALGLILHALAVSIFSIDWMLSLEPEFTSTIYALCETSAEVVGAFAVAVLVLAARRAVEVLPGGDEETSLSEDLANMQFGFLLTWIYLVFMQWIVVWGGDLPDEIHWYIVRATGSWQYLLWLLVALPAAAFAGSLSRPPKRSHDGLIWLAGIVLAGHFVDVFWRVRPPLLSGGQLALWHDAVAWIGVGGLWLALFLFLLRRPDRIVWWKREVAHG